MILGYGVLRIDIIFHPIGLYIFLLKTFETFERLLIYCIVKNGDICANNIKVGILMSILH